MNTFARRIAALALSTYRRWSFGPPMLWQVDGWGCDAGGLDLVEFTKRRLDGSLGNGAWPYCRAPTDLDMIIATGLVGLLAAQEREPGLVDLAPGDRKALVDVVRLLGSLVASRLVPGAVDSAGEVLPTVVLDPGVWASHPDW